MSKNEKMYNTIRYFEKINEKTYQLLGWLGFNKEETFDTELGVWEIYTRKNFTFPYFCSDFNPPMNKFCAIFKNFREFIIYGGFEKLEEVKHNLKKFTMFFLKKERKIMGIPLTLTEENAQDYGYTRGLIIGLFLMIVDFLYPLIFRFKNGIITGFIEYVKIIYYGTPGFGIFVGITGTGLYFIFLLIIIPIILGWIYKKRANKMVMRKIDGFLKYIEPYEYEFGIEAEKKLEEEFSLIVEEKKKEQIYNDLKKSIEVEKRDFELLYDRLKAGFLGPQDIINYLNDYKEVFKDFPLIDFLNLIIKYDSAKIATEIKFQPDVFQE